MKDSKPEEILNSLLKGTFDSIKEESLDIDLSACATIPSTSSNGCSLTPDFWLEEPEEANFLDIDADKRKNKRKSTLPKKSTSTSEICSDKSSDEHEVDFKFKCKVCNLLFETVKELSAHESTHEMAFQCNDCDRAFSNEGSLKKHAKSHKGGTKKDSVMECPDCGKLLKISSMWMHRKIHTDSKRYCCDICGQKFVQKINLTHHTKIHTGERPFECPQCKKTFPERSHLLRHQRYHSSNRPFKCEKCGKMYKTERCLKVHNLVHLEQRPFVCKVCNKSFISSSKLKQHSNIHTGERPYKCNYCSRDFTNFPNWLKHTRRRHKVDHKTGELLETVPKYSSKPKRTQKTAAAATVSVSKNSAEKTNIEKIITNEHRTSSLTSAEDLIMEQALELEESGLFATSRDDKIAAGQFNLCDTLGIKKEFSSYDSSPFSSPMGESGMYTPTSNVNVPPEFSFQGKTEIKEEICSYNSSPFSSPNYEFKNYAPLPPIATMTANNYFLKTSTTLPSVETLFAFSQQKAQTDF